MASADSPLKGVDVLLRAVAKVATERDIHLIVVSRLQKDGPTSKLVRELALGDRVKFVSGIPDEELGELMAGAEIAVVPSRYEGFSLPAVEHMASGTPLVASAAGALPEVVGDAAVLVKPGDVEELAVTLRRLHDSPEERARIGAAGYQRVLERYTWRAVAIATTRHYRAAIRQAR
jgi:glycosyltransferase involved in cell wall biosynthesis